MEVTGGYTLTTHTNLQNSLTVGFVGGQGGIMVIFLFL